MSERVTLEQMKGTLGSLLLLWSRIERTIRAELSLLHGGSVPKSAFGIAAALNAWEAAMVEDRETRPFQAQLASQLRTQLQRPLDIRNGVCHGLLGYSAAYGDDEGTLTWEINGVKESITWEELQEVFRWLSRVPQAISMISHAAAATESITAERSLPKREWWIAEFGINLPLPQDTGRAGKN